MAKSKEAASEAESILKQIEQAEVTLIRHDAAVKEAKEALKEAKEDHDNAVSELRRLCRIRSEENPLFDGDDE